jgi:hypothetical protein
MSVNSGWQNHSCGARPLSIDRRRQGHAASFNIDPIDRASEPRGHSRLPVPSPCLRRIAVVIFWVAILAVSILLYVTLDGFDLGIGILFGLTGNEGRRRARLQSGMPDYFPR